MLSIQFFPEFDLGGIKSNSHAINNITKASRCNKERFATPCGAENALNIIVYYYSPLLLADSVNSAAVLLKRCGNHFCVKSFVAPKLVHLV